MRYILNINWNNCLIFRFIIISLPTKKFDTKTKWKYLPQTLTKSQITNQTINREIQLTLKVILSSSQLIHCSDRVLHFVHHFLNTFHVDSHKRIGFLLFAYRWRNGGLIVWPQLLIVMNDNWVKSTKYLN